MWKSISRIALVALLVAVAATALRAVPVDAGGNGTITDRKNFIPNRKHVALPGKVIGVLVPDGQQVLSLEGRSGPADQLCLGYGGASYRWVYVPVEKDPMIPWISLPVGPTGAERKRFDKLSLANPVTVKAFGVERKYSLVEVEVNGGLGSPPDDSFAATRMKVLDGTAEYPLKVDEVIADLTRRYQDHVKGLSRDIDVGIEKAAAIAIKEKKSTGPRERQDVMFATWMPETQRLRVHFRTVISDGAYQYENGINIDLGLPAGKPAAPRAGPASKAPNMGLRYGTQFGIEFGAAYEVSRSGKLERTLTLPMETFQREIKDPGYFRGRAGAMIPRGTFALPPQPRTTAIKR